MGKHTFRLLMVTALLAGVVAGPMAPAWAHGGDPDDHGPAREDAGSSKETDMHDEGSGATEETPGDEGPTGVRTVEIEVSEDGFNGDPGPFRVRANQGEEIVLRFLYGDATHGHENVHVIEVEGLSLETGRLDAANPVQEIRFTPEKSGTFTFHCVYLCHGHANLQQGILSIGAATTLATEIMLDVRSDGGSGLVLMATVRDSRGRPVPGAPLHFLVMSSLFDSMVDVGESVTDPRGMATLPFAPTVTGLTQFEARFEGQDAFEGSQGIAEYPVTRAVPGPLMRRHGIAIPGLGTWVILALVAAVWTTYLFALSKLRRFATR